MLIGESKLLRSSGSLFTSNPISDKLHVSLRAKEIQPTIEFSGKQTERKEAEEKRVQDRYTADDSVSLLLC